LQQYLPPAVAVVPETRIDPGVQLAQQALERVLTTRQSPVGQQPIRDPVAEEVVERP
jgi:hypothetical protein